MKANEANLLKFLQGPKQFLIPIFQRRYSWEQRHCEQLWRDVLRIGQDKEAHAHFLGSVVYMEHGIYSASAVTQLVVIDGQQRLTTLSLLLCAMGRAIELQGGEIDITRKKLENYYLFNADEEGEYHYKQRLTRRDNDTLIQLLVGKELPADVSHSLVENYHFFEEKLKKADLKTVYEGIQKLIIVDISLNRDYDNAQLIFESLNSTGLELSQADLIRNYVLMEQDPGFQKRLYEDYWYPMEQRFGEEYTKRFDRFIRDYLTLKTGQIPKVNEVYDRFKDYTDGKKRPEALEEIIEDIHRHSKHYVRIARLEEEDSELHACLQDIHDLEVEVTFPLLLGVYEDYMQDQINKTDVIEVFRLIESYVFRRAICGIPTNSLHRTFAALTGKIDKENYVQSLKVAFCHMTGTQRFPSDAEFQQGFLVKDAYNFDRCIYLLLKLENLERKESISFEDYTIEHVMPQSLSEEWEAELGENATEVHEKCLHMIGNLTLTGYNPELSNSTFKEKQIMKGGFRDSPLRLNASLREAQQWNEDAIVMRAKMLSEKALNIWPHHGVPKETEQRQKESWTLDDFSHLNGEMLALFEQLKRRILDLDSTVSEQITKHYINYRIHSVILSVIPQANRLRLTLNLPYSDINDPRGSCRDLASLGHYGIGDVEVGISSADEIDYIMFLIHQAFKKRLAQ